MPRIGYTWNEEYRKSFYESDKVQAHLEKFIEQAKQPKSEEQKLKMAKAKKDVAKSEQHKANMAETHKFRQALKKEIVLQNPDLPINEVWDLVRIKMEHEDATKID